MSRALLARSLGSSIAQAQAQASASLLLSAPHHRRLSHVSPRLSLRNPIVDKEKRRRSMIGWWKRTLSQRFNSAGVASFSDVVTSHPQLALPQVSVPDIRWVDWAELERLGFCGVVFDKDNTLTAPYSLSLWPTLSDSLRRCRSVFPGRIAVFSNSAGLCQYDPDGVEARALEESIGGIHVIRHELNKPAGTAEEIEKYFGCSSSFLVMVGDRPFTDVVYGNRNGFLTILTEPLNLSEEPFIVQQVRKLEGYLINSWYQKGLKPIKHNLLLDSKRCIKPPSS